MISAMVSVFPNSWTKGVYLHQFQVTRIVRNDLLRTPAFQAVRSGLLLSFETIPVGFLLICASNSVTRVFAPQAKCRRWNSCLALHFQVMVFNEAVKHNFCADLRGPVVEAAAE